MRQSLAKVLAIDSKKNAMAVLGVGKRRENGTFQGEQLRGMTPRAADRKPANRTCSLILSPYTDTNGSRESALSAQMRLAAGSTEDKGPGPRVVRVWRPGK